MKVMNNPSSSMPPYRSGPVPRYRPRDRGKNTWGWIILGIGLFLLLKEFNLFNLRWKEIWPYLLLVTGLAIGLRNRFRNHTWWILIFIGLVNIIPRFEIFNISSASLVLPVAFIIGGALILLGSRRGTRCGRTVQVVSHDDQKINIDVYFGGRKEFITSKEFRGGKVNINFGGVELNLMQADSTEQPMVLETQTAFGGLELIIPSHWELRNEVETTVGNVEDQRQFRKSHTGDPQPTLVLKGSVHFGSIEVKSY